MVVSGGGDLRGGLWAPLVRGTGCFWALGALGCTRLSRAWAGLGWPGVGTLRVAAGVGRGGGPPLGHRLEEDAPGRGGWGAVRWAGRTRAGGTRLEEVTVVLRFLFKFPSFFPFRF